MSSLFQALRKKNAPDSLLLCGVTCEYYLSKHRRNFNRNPRTRSVIWRHLKKSIESLPKKDVIFMVMAFDEVVSKICLAL